jgi:hypothetical protein
MVLPYPVPADEAKRIHLVNNFKCMSWKDEPVLKQYTSLAARATKVKPSAVEILSRRFLIGSYFFVVVSYGWNCLN